MPEAGSVRGSPSLSSGNYNNLNSYNSTKGSLPNASTSLRDPHIETSEGGPVCMLGRWKGELWRWWYRCSLKLTVVLKGGGIRLSPALFWAQRSKVIQWALLRESSGEQRYRGEAVEVWQSPLLGGDKVMKLPASLSQLTLLPPTGASQCYL